MITELLEKQNIFFHLYTLDKIIAQECKKKPCPYCGGPLHFANYQRKPRGEPCELPDEYLRGTEINNSAILLVFQLVFCVASKDTYFNMLPLMRLEYELKSCAIFVELFISVPLTMGLRKDCSQLDEKLFMETFSRKPSPRPKKPRRIHNNINDTAM